MALFYLLPFVNSVSFQSMTLISNVYSVSIEKSLVCSYTIILIRCSHLFLLWMLSALFLTSKEITPRMKYWPIPVNPKYIAYGNFSSL